MIRNTFRGEAICAEGVFSNDTELKNMLAIWRANEITRKEHQLKLHLSSSKTSFGNQLSTIFVFSNITDIFYQAKIVDNLMTKILIAG